MYKTLLTLLFLLGLVLPSIGQSRGADIKDRLAAIRESYSIAREAMTYNPIEDEGPALNSITMSRHQNMSAVGITHYETNFYYDEVFEDDEPYPSGYTLNFVTYTHNIAAAPITEEFLYNENGTPMFYFTSYYEYFYESEQHAPAKAELRAYYDEKGNIIKTLFKVQEADGKMTEAQSYPEFTNKIADAKFGFDHFKAVFDAAMNSDNPYCE